MTGFAGVDRRQWWGYTDLGPVQIPPQPFYTILTDRADGATTYYVTFNPNSPPAQHFLDQLGNISIINAVNSKLRDVGYAKIPTFSLFPIIGGSYASYAIIYGVQNEPYVPNMPPGYSCRLFVRNGVLGAEIFAINDPRYSTQGHVENANSEPIFAINQSGAVGFGAAFRRIRWSDNTNPAGFVGWDPWVVNQTPNPPNVNSMANLSNPKADV